MKKKTYEITIYAHVAMTYEIEAETKDAAIDEAMESMEQGEAGDMELIEVYSDTTTAKALTPPAESRLDAIVEFTRRNP